MKEGPNVPNGPLLHGTERSERKIDIDVCMHACMYVCMYVCM